MEVEEQPIEDRRRSLLVNEDGSPVVPTEIPPETGFDDYKSPPPPQSDPMEDQNNANNTRSRSNADPVREEEEEDPFAIRKSKTTGTALKSANDTSKPSLKRAGTAPSSRPAPVYRSSSILATLKRSTTGTGNNTTDSVAGAPYTFNFDPPESDNELDSSSSSSEDEVRRRKQKKTRHRRPYSRFAINNEYIRTKGKVSGRDGRLNLSVNETANTGYLAKALSQSIRNHLDLPSRHRYHNERRSHQGSRSPISQDADAESLAASLRETVTRPHMNIVIMVIGSRGDIQPFLKVGRVLRGYGHRVRIATHPTFREFVEQDQELEFFSVGGNPSELMAFMVKNPGLIPNLQTVREGEISRRRAQMFEMFDGFWRACINSTDDESDRLNLKLMGQKAPFVADAIIANPPSFAHVHIAERLGIPLHMMFTFPYSPTQQFPHPLANIKPSKSNVDASYVNFMSYPLVEMLTWNGLGDLVNKFRVKTLGLEPVSSLWAPGALYRMRVPYTYLWSPSLVPKPKDWGPEIDIAGFTFLDLGSNFQPPKALTDFLDAGEPPIYIGFGSIVVDDAKAFTDMIFKAVKLAGVRALVNEGWGGIGKGDDVPENIFLLGNTPHDWLFPKCKAVVHHGGAGTTAIGLKCAKPTMIVPFFGDQPFWGAMVADARAGAFQCTPYKKLTAERLGEGIKQCLTDEAQSNVQRIADSISKEGDGAENAVKSFHRSLPLAGKSNMRCSILEDRVAIWRLRNSSLRLSALAAEILVEKGKIRFNELHLLHHHEWNDFDGPGEPITGGAGAVAKSLYGVGEGVGMVPVRIAQAVQKHEAAERKKREFREKKEEHKRKKARQAAERAAIDQHIASQSNDPEISNAQAANEAEARGERPTVAREQTDITLASTVSNAPSEHFLRNVAGDVGRGLKSSGKALVTMPNDLAFAVAQGFHNAPRLYGDGSVRKPVKITGFKTSCTAARKEFGYGVYDGFTGVVTQPVRGWKDGMTVPAKFAGLGSGMGKGIGGLVLKNITAVVAPPAFLGKGVVKTIEKRMGGPGTNNFIRRAHIVQGQKDMEALKKEDTPQQRQELKQIMDHVSRGWKVYEEIWDAAHKYRDASGRGLMRQRKFDRERRRWEANGALENTKTASKALNAIENGEDLEELFWKRKKEMALAETPRAPAMEQPTEFEDATHVLPNGRTIDGAMDTIDTEDEEDDASRTLPPPRPRNHSHTADDSSATAVDSEDEAGKRADKPQDPARFAEAGMRKASLLGDLSMANRRVISN